MICKEPRVSLSARCPVFGPVVEDGYGFCYNLKQDQIYAGMTCFRSNGKTSTAKLEENLAQSLRDVHRVLVESTASKL
jgi:carnitine O-acetyltransferase